MGRSMPTRRVVDSAREEGAAIDPARPATLGSQSSTPDTVPDGWSWGWAHHMLRAVSLPDVQTLIDLHTEITGGGRGRRPPEVQVLSRSAIVLTCAYWEAFCEDLVAEALEHLADYATADHVPKSLKASIAKNVIDADKDERAPWALAGEGWRTVLRARASTLRSDNDQTLNTPNTRKVRELFRSELGMTDVTSSWWWRKNTTAQVATALNEFVTLRGAIAHRGAPTHGVQKQRATKGLDLVHRLADVTALTVWTFVHEHSHAPFSSYDPGHPVVSPGQPTADRAPPR